MGVRTSDPFLVPPFWAVDPARLSPLGQHLWPKLLAGFVPSRQWGLQDVKGNPALRLTLNGGATIDERGLVCDAAGEGAEATLPEYLKVGYPLTLLWYGYSLGAKTGFAHTFGIPYNTSASSPFFAAMIDNDNAGHIRAGFQSNGTLTNVVMSVGYDTTPQAVLLSAGISSVGGLVGAAYKNLMDVTTGSGSNGTPNHTSASLIAIGNYTGISRNSNMVTIAAYMLHWTMQRSEISDLMMDPLCLVRPILDRRTAFARKGTGGTVAGIRRRFAAVIG
jgi:hypothetical protein